MVKAVIFDMNGLLINSEPLWRRAEAEVFRKVGFDFTPDLAKHTAGMRTDEVVAYWYRRHPWDGLTHQEVQQRIEHRAIELLTKEAEPMPGIEHALAICADLGLPTAVASSAAMPIICNALTKLGIKDKFTVIHSAEFEPYGKPHPAVYISVARKLDIPPSMCLALEDSINGAVAAKSAKMHCIAVPDTIMRHDKAFGIADMTLCSLADMQPDSITSL